MASARILCVDDDPRINDLNQAVLTRIGYEVVIAIDPAEGLERFKQETFDLVLTDLFSPESAAINFIKNLRGVSPNIPIVVVSGNHQPPQEVLKQADAFVTKAYSINGLTDAVREVLTREKLRRIG
jgi:CheY-like chemotaxis protein